MAILQSVLIIILIFLSFMNMVLNMKSSFEIMTNTVLSVDRIVSSSVHFYFQHRFHLNEFSLGNSIGNFLESYSCSIQAQIGEICVN